MEYNTDPKPIDKHNWAHTWNERADKIHQIARSHGFWDEGEARNSGELICLMHSELSEALEAIREGNGPSEHIPEFSGLEEEMADTVIRIMDFCYAKKLRITQAIDAKLEFNAGRPHRHGKLF